MKSLVYPYTFLRAILAVLAGSLATVVGCIVVVIGSLIGWKKLVHVYVPVAWGYIVVRSAGVFVKTIGRENIPKGGCLFLFHHTSHYDITVLYVALRCAMRFGAKVELFKIPFLSRAMRTLNVLPIERSSREKVLRMYRSIYESVQKGDRIILAPEGTRQCENKIGKFKNGPFIFAIEGKAPIVPIVIANAGLALHKDSVLPNIGRMCTEVVVKVLPPIDASQYTIEQVDDLQNLVQKKMVDGLKEILPT